MRKKLGVFDTNCIFLETLEHFMIQKPKTILPKLIFGSFWGFQSKKVNNAHSKNWEIVEKFSNISAIY